MAQNQGLVNLNQAITDLNAQIVLTTTAIQNLQNASGDSDADVQAAADAVNAAKEALKNVTPAV